MHLAAALVGQRQRALARGQRRRDQLLDLGGGLRALEHDLARRVQHADLDLHAVLQYRVPQLVRDAVHGSRVAAARLPTGAAPSANSADYGRPASAAARAAGSSRCRARAATRSARPRSAWAAGGRSASHQRAATWPAPVSATDSSSALVGVEAGVGGDRLGHRPHRLLGHSADPVAHGRIVAEVGLEDQPERAVVAARLAVDEVEVGRHDAVHPLLVVVGGGQRLRDRRPTAPRSGRRAGPGRARACPGSAGRARAWTPRPVRRCRPSPAA